MIRSEVYIPDRVNVNSSAGNLSSVLLAIDDIEFLIQP